jgi:hypothetical protein
LKDAYVTPCRKVGFDTQFKEIEHSHLTLAEAGLTSIEPDFPTAMFAVLKGGRLV